ncbi:FAD-dependent oxidoreductase [Flavobacteriaceae bacterium]|nr:FAD-dependent oxidoreductase [Flavobacteriaceae bacterium]
MKKCIVIGGGIIGLSTAYFLQKQGHEVTVLDASDKEEGASYVNAGYITPSHFIPLAAPGMISKGLKYMFDSSSPFYMKPRLDLGFLEWSFRFFKASTKKHLHASMAPIYQMNTLSRNLYSRILEETGIVSQFDAKGLMMYFQTEEAKTHEVKLAEQANRLFGIDTGVYDKNQIQDKFEPHIEMNILGGVHYPCDRQMTPGEFMREFKTYLKTVGVNLEYKISVEDFEVKGGKVVKLYTNHGSYQADEFVLCTGAWTPKLAKKLNIKLLIEAGKGYRLDVFENTGINMSAILVERNMAVSPMDGFTRLAGTMEIAGMNSQIRKERVTAIKNGAEAFYKELKVPSYAAEKAAYGMRPVSFDGLPFIGKAEQLNNLTIASGHAMMGWSLGPVTGKLVQELIDDHPKSMNIDAFRVNR